jgi:hypothetical protein
MDSIKRNKLIIATSTIALVFLIFCLILSNSEINGSLSFHYVHNQNTGEPLSLIASIFLYILFWWFIGLVPSAAVFLFSLILYYFLHCKDKRLLERRYHPPYEEEFYLGGKVAFTSTYIAVLILLLLQISNFVSISVF